MGKITINRKQLPIKAHFFFFMAAMGPILPFLTVYGKQLGISPVVMGTFTAILPILFLLSKPAFGYLVDYFCEARKFIFMGLLIVTSLAFVSMYFLQNIETHPRADNDNNVQGVNVTLICDELVGCDESRKLVADETKVHNETTKKAACLWSCDQNNTNYSATVIFAERNASVDSFCVVDSSINETFRCNEKTRNERECKLSCDFLDHDQARSLYGSLTFWGFVLFVSVGSIGFNVSNSITDAICFDVLGEGGQMGYGRQRVWGAIGFGVTALLAGYAVDVWSEGQAIKTYTPAFVLVFALTCFDVLCSAKLELPIMRRSKSIARDVYELLRHRPIVIFLCFATLAGIFDGFIIYFMFWYLEDLAAATGHMGQIKLIEGLIVAAETLGGEVIFFTFSGKILKKFGYGYSFVFCFVCYSLRLGLVSIAPNPWWVVPFEFFMQGPTYALCYTTIVAFASAVAPPGASATVQGIVAGMDDGFGFALGSLAGGIMYKKLGGAVTFRVFSMLASVSAVLYLVLHVAYLKKVMPETKATSGGSANVPWKSPKEAAEICHVEEAA